MKIHNTNNYTKQASPNFGSGASVANKILNPKSALGKISKNIEYDGLDMSFPVMCAAMIGGVLIPRLIQAQDKYDREEILRRDITSEAAIVFGAAALSKIFLKHEEQKSGFVLMKKPEDFANKTKFKKFMDYFMPNSALNPANSKQLIARYSGLNASEDGKGILHFCDYINNNGGDLNKFFSTTKPTKDLLSEICGGKEIFEKANNDSIKESIAKAMEETPEKIAELYKHFENKDNAFIKKAKSMNSKFKFLSVFVFIPAILGFALPAINEKMTKKKYRKDHNQDQAKATSTNSAYQAYKNPYFMSVQKTENINEKDVFDKIETK